ATAGSAEDEAEPAGAPPGEAGPGQAPRPDSKTPNLDQFTYNLTERAKKGEIDPVIGRDAEIRQVIDILTRRRQNNPILAGGAGAGQDRGGGSLRAAHRRRGRAAAAEGRGPAHARPGPAPGRRRRQGRV